MVVKHHNSSLELEITAVCVDMESLKYYLGDKNGVLYAHSISNAKLLNSMKFHKSEITSINVIHSKGLITVSLLDGYIFV